MESSSQMARSQQQEPNSELDLEEARCLRVTQQV